MELGRHISWDQAGRVGSRKPKEGIAGSDEGGRAADGRRPLWEEPPKPQKWVLPAPCAMLVLPTMPEQKDSFLHRARHR